MKIMYRVNQILIAASLVGGVSMGTMTSVNASTSVYDMPAPKVTHKPHIKHKTNPKNKIKHKVKVVTKKAAHTMSHNKTKVTTKAYKYDANAAKTWIAMRESGGNYYATHGRYYGKYQLDRTYLHGDYSKHNQELAADKYVHNRYGSWANAKQHWLSHNWY